MGSTGPPAAWFWQAATNTRSIHRAVPPPIRYLLAKSIFRAIYAGTTAQSPPRAYLMTTMQQDLGDLGGGSSSANGLNSFDQVVRVSGYAFIWDQANGIRRLDSSTTSSSAIAINDASLVVGSAHVNTCGGSARPNAVYWQAGVFYALPQLGG